MRGRGAVLAITFFGNWLMRPRHPAQAEVLKREPAMGALKEGQVVLVDDGKCPKGQIRQVVGGNHTDVGGMKRIKRSSSCVPRN
jgi:hypothetical protein